VTAGVMALLYMMSPLTSMTPARRCASESPRRQWLPHRRRPSIQTVVTIIETAVPLLGVALAAGCSSFYRADAREADARPR